MVRRGGISWYRWITKAISLEAAFGVMPVINRSSATGKIPVLGGHTDAVLKELGVVVVQS